MYVEKGKRYSIRGGTKISCDYVEITNIDYNIRPHVCCKGRIHGGIDDGCVWDGDINGNYMGLTGSYWTLLNEYQEKPEKLVWEDKLLVSDFFPPEYVALPKICDHEYVNVSFSENPEDARFACKHCGESKPDFSITYKITRIDL